MTAENWETVPPPAPAPAGVGVPAGQCCTVDEDGREGHFTVALHVAQALRAALRAAEQERDKARAWAKRWKAVAQEAVQERRTQVAAWATDCRELAGQYRDAEQEREAARADLARAEAVLRFYADSENWELRDSTNGKYAFSLAEEDNGERARAFFEAQEAKG